VNKRELEEEMAQLVKSKTEVECLVEDMRSSQTQGFNQRSSLQKQLKKIQQAVQAKEVELMELEPEWDRARTREREARQAFVSFVLIMYLLNLDFLQT
jgi:structural maintenance of chromosome 3 (chondroitin sulfate proteoglycan 6)